MRSSSTQGHTRHPPFDFQDQANATTFLFYLKLSRLENSNLVYVTPNEPNQYGGNLLAAIGGKEKATGIGREESELRKGAEHRDGHGRVSIT